MIIEDLNLRLESKQISIKITDNVRDELIKNGFDPNFGARPLKRLIEQTIENEVARKMVENKVKEGDVVEIDHI